MSAREPPGVIRSAYARAGGVFGILPCTACYAMLSIATEHVVRCSCSAHSPSRRVLVNGSPHPHAPPLRSPKINNTTLFSESTSERMAELELRLPILHPEASDAEVVIGFHRINAKHEALPNLAPICRRKLKRHRSDSTPSLRTIRLNSTQEKNKRCAAKHSPLFLRRLPISSMGGCYSRVEVEKWRLR